MAAKYYFLKLNPCRANFAQTMTSQENQIMQEHISYCTSFLNNGKIVAYGPVLDPKGAYGVAIMKVDDEQEVKDFIANDPASSINRYDYFPMLASITNAIIQK
jgi:uncharacterized protein